MTSRSKITSKFYETKDEAIAYAESKRHDEKAFRESKAYGWADMCAKAAKKAEEFAKAAA